jgi:hypothetical protein
LREQHPGQHQILPFPRVAQVVVGAEATFPCPAGGRGEVALGQLQPRLLRGDGVEQDGHAQTGRDFPASLIASSAPAGSPLDCRIHASVARPSASGWVKLSCRHSVIRSGGSDRLASQAQARQVLHQELKRPVHLPGNPAGQ